MITAALPNRYIITVLALIKFAIPFLLISPVFELQRDEYLYYQQGQHFDLGYLENPPLLSYLGSISGLFGGSIFWVRFWPALIGAATVVLTGLITAELGGKKFAQLIAGLGILTGAFMRVHVLFQPNILDIFFWALSIYFLILYFKHDDKKFFYSFAVVIALGFWSKYSIVFLAVSIVLGLLLTKQRKIFAKGDTYKALLVALVIMAPNIFWQYEHKWPLIHHMEELQESQLKFLNPLDFIIDQLLYLFPIIFIWITGLIWVFRKKEYRVIGWTYAFVIILLLLGRGKSYYSLGIYPVLIAAGAVAWEKITQRLQWLRYIVVVYILTFTLLFLPTMLPLWSPDKLAAFYKKYQLEKLGLLKWEDQKNHPLPQDFADMLGWKELTDKSKKFFNSLPDSTKEDAIIFCGNYGEAGALTFFGKGDDYFTSKVASFNGSFLLWIPDRLYFQHVLYINDRAPGQIFSHFKKSTIIDSISNPFAREYGTKIIFFENIDLEGLNMLRDRLIERKGIFTR